jgi:hypothetical protein
MAPRLKVFNACEENDSDFVPEANVRVRLGDLLPFVAMAQRRNFLWLKDFLDDEVAITDDLYDVLQTFSEYRPSA